MAHFLILADDISGAAETAGAIAAATSARVELRLVPSADPAPDVLVIDTNSRGVVPGQAAELSRAAAGSAPGQFIYKKVDSLLRGNIRAELEGLDRAAAGIVAALAVPRAHRTVSGGVMHVAGTALHHTAAWAHEAGVAPSSIGAALGLPSAIIPLEVVRGSALDAAVLTVLAAGEIAVCDGETEDDLDRVAAMIIRLDRPIVAVGTGGLVRSIAALLGLAAGEPVFRPGADRIIAVVGTLVPSARDQVARLVETGLRQVTLRPGIPVLLDGADAVVTLAADPTWSALAIEGVLSDVAAAIRGLDGRTDLVLTGGHTARMVLDALGVTRLYAEDEVEAGAVLSTTLTGSAVVTRPGSFGDDESLVRIVSHLRGTQS